MKPVKLSIPAPCQEDWSAMTPDATGRFCSVCQKSVVDFTRMSDREVIKYFQNQVGQRVCVRVQQYRLSQNSPAAQRPRP